MEVFGRFSRYFFFFLDQNWCFTAVEFLMFPIKYNTHLLSTRLFNSFNIHVYFSSFFIVEYVFSQFRLYITHTKLWIPVLGSSTNKDKFITRCHIQILSCIYLITNLLGKKISELENSSRIFLHNMWENWISIRHFLKIIFSLILWHEYFLMWFLFSRTNDSLIIIMQTVWQEKKLVKKNIQSYDSQIIRKVIYTNNRD